MNTISAITKTYWLKFRTSAYTKWTARILLALFVLVFVAYLSMAWYINQNKPAVLASITAALSENLNGDLTIGSMEPAFLEGFPLLSLNLKNVRITDSLYPVHKRMLLRADHFDISVNAFALLRGAVEIRKIGIHDAAIDMFTDSNGYSNTSVFRAPKTSKGGEGGSYPEVRRFTLDNVKMVIDNKQKSKLFDFDVRKLKGSINYNDSGWQANIDLNVHAQSMAFSTKKGSFIKNNKVEGDLIIQYALETQDLTIEPGELNIGGEEFVVSADFGLGKQATHFKIEIRAPRILWKDASRLLSPNISSRLDMFDLSEPIAVTCLIEGDFNELGDPLIHVKATIRDNTLQTPGGTVSNCSFDGEFINNHVQDAGFNDANSSIKILELTGDYNEIPIRLKQTYILNFEEPVAVGNFESSFNIEKLGNFIDTDLLDFSKGKADVNLKYTADIVNFTLTKPIVEGVVNIKNADVRYVPRNLAFKDISVGLNFKDEDLFISKVHLQSGKSIVDMEGEIRNFLNLYYTAPEQIVLKWKVTSPHLHLGEFVGFLGQRKKSKTKTASTKGNFTEEINDIFENSKVDMSLNVDKLYYGKFFASDVKASLFLDEKGITVKDAGLKHAGGLLKLNGTLLERNNGSSFNMNTVVTNVDISKFFYAFDNFGQQALKPGNLKGFLSVKSGLSGTITTSGTLVPKSMNGNVLYSLRKAALINFDPIRNVGRFAFPNRDLNTISIPSLDGSIDIRGEKVTVHPLKINSSVLNMDVDGVYSFGKGTELYLSVPLRNPERDKDITDKKELAKRRNRGIVINLVAKDDKAGKVKIGLGKRAKE